LQKNELKKDYNTLTVTVRLKNVISDLTDQLGKNREVQAQRAESSAE
jgi:hypothetical protein